MQYYCKKWVFYSLWLYFVSSSHAIDLRNAAIKDGQTVAIYTGAFDPIHLGHDEVIRYALSNNIANHVIVAPDSKFNQHKPFITDIKQRNMLLSFLYDTEATIVTTDLNYQAILNYLSEKFKNIKRIAILGSDNYLRHVQEDIIPTLTADTWLLIPRDKDKNNPLLKKHTSFVGQPIILADIKYLKYQGYSSTQVRNLRQSHPEFILDYLTHHLINFQLIPQQEILFVILNCIKISLQTLQSQAH